VCDSSIVFSSYAVAPGVYGAFELEDKMDEENNQHGFDAVDFWEAIIELNRCGEVMTTVESSNPGPVGMDTGYEFTSPKTGSKIRVIAKTGEDRASAIARVRRNHGL